MTGLERIIVTNRTTGEVAGFTNVTAEVDGGANGNYLIANQLVGTDAELAEILAQSMRRMEAIGQTEAGIA